MGVFSVTLKSRPTTTRFVKAKNSIKGEKNKVGEHGDACVFWEYSGSVR